MIIWSPRGRLRLNQCVRYIALESQDWLTAVNWRTRILDSTAHLSDFPLSGTIVREIGRKDIRQIFVGDYRIVYRIKNGNPEIISVRHTHYLIKSMHSL